MFTPNEKHIIVNYHYVEDPRSDRSAFYSCSVREFERQVRFLSEQYRFATIDEVYKGAQEGSAEKLCALTFDDGLRDQYDHAVPILKTHNAHGIFFIMGTTLEGFVPATHQLHIILSRFDPEELVQEYNGFLKEHFSEQFEKFNIPTDRRLTTKRKMRDSVVTANFKEMMNIVPGAVRKTFLEKIMERKSINEKELSEELFMDRHILKELHMTGFEIGNHSYKHRALDCLTKAQAKRDIEKADRVLQEVTREKLTIFSYPHGGYNDELVEILTEIGYNYAVIIGGTQILRRGVVKGDNPFALSRYDTNDIRDFLNGENTQP